MSEALRGKAVTVMTIGMDSRKQAIFRMAFKMHTVQLYRLSDDAPGVIPDIAIIDMDTVGAESLWLEFRNKHPEMPALVTTVTPSDDLPAPVIAKPIRIDALFPLLRDALSGVLYKRKEKKDEQAKLKAELQLKKTQIEVSSAQKTVKLETSEPQAQGRITKPVVAPDTPLPEVKSQTDVSRHVTYSLPSQVLRFDPMTGLLGLLYGIRQSRAPSTVCIGGVDSISVDPSQDNVVLLNGLSVGDLEEFCKDNCGQQLTVRTPPNGKLPTGNSISLTALLWRVSLWTSRGRMLNGVQVDTPVRLRHWPNLTRLAVVPDALRIAAFWVRFPVTIRLTVKMLNVSPDHVFDMLAAAYSIGILEIKQQANTITKVEPVLPQPQTEEKKSRGGLLSRLLKKVRGL